MVKKYMLRVHELIVSVNAIVWLCASKQLEVFTDLACLNAPATAIFNNNYPEQYRSEVYG